MGYSGQGPLGEKRGRGEVRGKEKGEKGRRDCRKLNGGAEKSQMAEITVRNSRGMSNLNRRWGGGRVEFRERRDGKRQVSRVKKIGKKCDLEKDGESTKMERGSKGTCQAICVVLGAVWRGGCREGRSGGRSGGRCG